MLTATVPDVHMSDVDCSEKSVDLTSNRPSPNGAIENGADRPVTSSLTTSPTTGEIMTPRPSKPVATTSPSGAGLGSSMMG